MAFWREMAAAHPGGGAESMRDEDRPYMVDV